MKKRTFTFVLLLVNISVISAQQLTQHNEFKELGLSFDLPQGWNGQLYEDKIILGHYAIPGMILLTENPINNAKEMKALAMQGITEEGIVFKPVSEFKLISPNRVEGFYQGYFNGTEVKVFVIGLINGLGKGVNIIILTEFGKFTNQHIAAANELATSVKFYQSKDSATTLNWKNKIAGMKLKYMNTHGGVTGFSTAKSLDLCSDGSFYYYGNDHSSFDSGSGFGYANSNNEGQGKYSIHSAVNQAFLSLKFNSGDVYEFKLSSELGKTYLDDDRYFVVVPPMPSVCLP